VRSARLLLSLAFVVATGCGGKSACDSPRSPTPLDHATTGTIAGVVRFTGEPPATTTLSLGAEPACAGQHSGPVPAGDVLVQDGRVENAFVYLKEGLGDRVFAVPAEPVTVDQRGCLYHPRVVGAQTCQEIAFVNSDPLLHNVHGTPHASGAWNWSMGVKGSRRTTRLAEPEVMVDVRCDVHPWMHAYVGVVAHPYFAVTGPDGAFSLRDVPPGDYVVASWHERFGTREARVTLAREGRAEVALTYAAGK
jgi:plastocyanin